MKDDLDRRHRLNQRAKLDLFQQLISEADTAKINSEMAKEEAMRLKKLTEKLMILADQSQSLTDICKISEEARLMSAAAQEALLKSQETSRLYQQAELAVQTARDDYNQEKIKQVDELQGLIKLSQEAQKVKQELEKTKRIEAEAEIAKSEKQKLHDEELERKKQEEIERIETEAKRDRTLELAETVKQNEKLENLEKERVADHQEAVDNVISKAEIDKKQEATERQEASSKAKTQEQVEEENKEKQVQQAISSAEIEDQKRDAEAELERMKIDEIQEKQAETQKTLE
ncbi:MAG: hypothetical protein EHJ95_05605, partial [Methanobacteriota archaeon]